VREKYIRRVACLSARIVFGFAAEREPVERVVLFVALDHENFPVVFEQINEILAIAFRPALGAQMAPSA
jgi:hypothetical protein